jgi:hypothetical protein
VKTASKAKRVVSKRAPSTKVPASPKKAASVAKVAKKGTVAANVAKKGAVPAKVAKKGAVPAKVAKKGGIAAKKSPPPVAARRADYGAPIDGFLAKQPPHLRAVLEELRALVEKEVPEATASLKWGMPNFAIGKSMVCAMAGFKSHVNLIVMGPPEIFDDPDGRLEGGAKGGRHIKLRGLDEVPRDAVRRWVRAAAALHR